MKRILTVGIMVAALAILLLSVSGNPDAILVKFKQPASKVSDNSDSTIELSFASDESVYENVIVHGGEYQLTFSYDDINGLESEVMQRLSVNSNEPFKKYFIFDEDIGIYLGTEYTPLIIDQGEEGVLLLLVENTELNQVKANYPGKELLSSEEEMVLRVIIEGLFGDNIQEVYIPIDYIEYDRYPMPPLIVLKQKGIAVSYKDLGDRKYLAFGLDTDPLTSDNAYYNMENIIKRNAIFQASGDGMKILDDFSQSQEPTTPPTTEPTTPPTTEPTIEPTQGPTPIPEYSNTIVVPLMALLIYGFLTVKKKK